MSGVVTLGETLGLFAATEVGSLERVQDFRLGIGGAESNVAVGVARLGVPSTWIGRVGADGIGERIQRELRAERVDARVIVDEAAPTAIMIKHRPVGGRSAVLYHRAGSAGSRLRPEDVDAARIRSAAVLHVSGITPALSPSASAAVDHAVAVASDAGVPVSFDVNHRTALWRGRDAAASHRRVAAASTLLFAGLDEVRMLIDDPRAEPMDAALAAAELGPRDVIVKLGPDGCVALLDGEQHVVPAVPVDVVDTVGAGDAFVAGYLAELVSGAPARQRLATAALAGAFACLGPGDWESLPTRADLALLSGDEPVQR